MSRAYHIAVLLLCISAGAIFIKLKSLPQLNDVLYTQASITSHINQATFESLKRKAFNAIKSATSKESVVEDAKNELEKTSAFADTLSLNFDKVESGEVAVESLQRRLKELNDLVRKGLVSAPDFFPPLKEGITKLDSWENISSRTHRKLLIENIRYESYGVLTMYIDSLYVITEGTNFRFDQGFPKPEESWKKGLIAFNPPVAMELNERERIQIRISKDLHIDLLKKMPSSETAEIDSLLVGDAMIVRLTGDDFDIVPYDEEQQGVTDGGYTQWEFDITPKSTGTHALFVKAGIVYSIPGIGPTKKFFPVYEKQIQIHVDTWKRVASFATERWEFLISTFLIPALTWAWSRFRKRV